LRWEDFAYYDDSMFTAGTLMGHDIVPTIVRESGRFFIGGQEFDLIRHFTDANTGYHLLPIAELLIFSYILLILDSELSITARAALAILPLLTPGILISFSMLPAPEHNVLFLLACLALSVRRFEQTRLIAWAVAAVVCAQIMIYYKETSFLLILGFAVGRLILRCRNVREAGWDYQRLWDKESRLDWCLAALAVLFLLFYFAVMGILALMGTHEGIHGSMGYAVERQRQDLPDPAPPGGTIAVVGWTGFWWGGLLPWPRCWSSYIRRHLPGTGGPHRSALCWSVCGAVLEQDALVGKAGNFGAGVDHPASGRLVFGIRRIREKERYSRKGPNSIRCENAISEPWRRYPPAFFPVCQPLRDHGICLLP